MDIIASLLGFVPQTDDLVSGFSTASACPSAGGHPFKKKH